VPSRSPARLNWARARSRESPLAPPSRHRNGRLEKARYSASSKRAQLITLLLVAAGGDPHRDLDVDDRAVKAVAADLYTKERRDELARAIDGSWVAGENAGGFQGAIDHWVIAPDPFAKAPP